METTLYRVTATLNKKGLKIKEEPIRVVEHTKCYDTIEGKTRRFRKQNLGKIDTNLKNDINSEEPTISFHTVVLRDDLNIAKGNVLEKVESRLKQLKNGLEGLLQHIVIY